MIAFPQYRWVCWPLLSVLHFPWARRCRGRRRSPTWPLSHPCLFSIRDRAAKNMCGYHHLTLLAFTPLISLWFPSRSKFLSTRYSWDWVQLTSSLSLSSLISWQVGTWHRPGTSMPCDWLGPNLCQWYEPRTSVGASGRHYYSCWISWEGAKLQLCEAIWHHSVQHASLWTSKGSEPRPREEGMLKISLWIRTYLNTAHSRFCPVIWTTRVWVSTTKVLRLAFPKGWSVGLQPFNVSLT